MGGSSDAPATYPAIEALQRLAEVFARRRAQLARGAGVSETQWRVLEEVASDDFMPSLFARRRGCSPAAVSKLIRQLVDKGLVSVALSKRDARQRCYRLTARGRRTHERLRRERERAIEAVWADLDPGQLARFARFSRELAGRLEGYAEGVQGNARARSKHLINEAKSK